MIPVVLLAEAVFCPSNYGEVTKKTNILRDLVKKKQNIKKVFIFLLQKKIIP